MKSSTRSLITIADEEVPILSACSFIGMDLPDGIAEGRTPKVHCPFGTVHHSDGGIEPAMRIYVESNHVFCFAGCGTFGPVALVAHAFEMTRRTAARELLNRIGYRVERRDVWTEQLRPEPPNTAMLAEALKTFCRRIEPEWTSRQFDPKIAGMFSSCLGLLIHVKTPKTAQTWLDSCKTFMAALLRPDGVCDGADHCGTTAGPLREE